MATLTVQQSVDRMFELASKRIDAEWGHGSTLIGTRLQRALYAEELLRILAMQDSEVSDAKVRQLLNEAYASNMDM